MTSYYVSPLGNDAHDGTLRNPFRTIGRAKRQVESCPPRERGDTVINLMGGIYRLNETLRFSAESGGDGAYSVSFRAWEDEKPVICGSVLLTGLDWQSCGNGVYSAQLPEPPSGDWRFDQLFVNGARMDRARFPNRDDSIPGESGYLALAGELPLSIAKEAGGDAGDMVFPGSAPLGALYDPTTFSPNKWKNPSEGIIHVFQSKYWGNLQFKLSGLDSERNILWFGQGGTQIGAKWHEFPCSVDHRSRYYIENIREELDAPGEWYYDREDNLLFVYPREDVDLQTAEIEVPVLQRLIEVIGSHDAPVRGLRFEGICFRHTMTTYFEEYDIPSLGDWAIHRGGAVYFENAAECVFKGNAVIDTGGNAVFFNNYNRNHIVDGNLFTRTGDSAVCLVGTLGKTVGSQRFFPFECEVRNNHIYDCGIYGKQVAGVFISVARRITASHNYIHTMPRAGICINDGTWGGHVVEYNRIHDTCLETADHGSFNAWGRDRYWCLMHSHPPKDMEPVCHTAGKVKTDQMETVIIRYNYFSENSGWGLDLDDGASNYHIYRNLCVGVSMKLREGAYRLIENNIWVNGANSPCFHVGNTDNHDIYRKNITVMNTKNARAENDLNFEMGNHYGELYTLIRPPFKGKWLEEVDYNLFYNDLGCFSARASVTTEDSKTPVRYDFEQWRALGFDEHSVYADPQFVDPENGDYRVKETSPALKLGFENFSMDEFGLCGEYSCRYDRPHPKKDV